MKKGFLFILMIIGFVANAQTSQSTIIEFNKAKVSGVNIVIAGYDFEFIQTALLNRLEKVAGLKGTNSKGFRVYLAQTFPEFGTLNYDIYTRVVKPSKKERSVTIELMVSKGNENFVTPTGEPELTQKMKDFLNAFVPYLKEYERSKKLETLTNTISQCEKELKTLTSDRDKLKKDFIKLENKLKGKENEIISKESELQNAKNELDVLKNN